MGRHSMRTGSQAIVSIDKFSCMSIFDHPLHSRKSGLVLSLDHVLAGSENCTSMNWVH